VREREIFEILPFTNWKIFKIFEILPFREREREVFLKFYHLPITIYHLPITHLPLAHTKKNFHKEISKVSFIISSY